MLGRKNNRNSIATFINNRMMPNIVILCMNFFIDVQNWK